MKKKQNSCPQVSDSMRDAMKDHHIFLLFTNQKKKLT